MKKMLFFLCCSSSLLFHGSSNDLSKERLKKNLDGLSSRVDELIKKIDSRERNTNQNILATQTALNDHKTSVAQNFETVDKKISDLDQQLRKYLSELEEKYTLLQVRVTNLEIQKEMIPDSPIINHQNHAVSLRKLYTALGFTITATMLYGAMHTQKGQNYLNTFRERFPNFSPKK